MLPGKSRYGKGGRRALGGHGGAGVRARHPIPCHSRDRHRRDWVQHVPGDAGNLRGGGWAGLRRKKRLGFHWHNECRRQFHRLVRYERHPHPVLRLSERYRAYKRHLRHHLHKRRYGRPVYQYKRHAHAQVHRRHHWLWVAVHGLGAGDPEAELAPWRKDRIAA